MIRFARVTLAFAGLALSCVAAQADGPVLPGNESPFLYGGWSTGFNEPYGTTLIGYNRPHPPYGYYYGRRHRHWRHHGWHGHHHMMRPVYKD